MFNKKNQPENTEPMHEETPETASPPAAPRSATTGGASTVLAEGSKFVGNVQVVGTLRIEGRCEGDLRAEDCIVVGKTGDVEATASTKRAVVNGSFHGKIEASDRVEMQSGSKVEADVKAKHMVMEDGVQFLGNCQIGS